MQEVLTALEDQHAELEAMASGLDDAGWKTPSRCAGWSVADVVLHLAQTDEMAIASLEGRMEQMLAGFPPTASSIDEGADMMVQAERSAGSDEHFKRWQERSSHLRSLFAACDPSARLTWVVGTLSARTLATTRMTECWIHTGDIAHGLGVEQPPTGRLWHIARLAHRTLPYAFTLNGREMTGPVRFELAGPGGEDWTFGDDAPTVVAGPALDLCMVAARRTAPADTALHGSGPDYDAVLDVVRTWA